MNVYVLPTTGQDAARQSTAEAECFQWAVQDTGVDPFDLAKKAEQAHQLTAEQIENFKKAFSVCLEAKEFMVGF